MTVKGIERAGERACVPMGLVGPRLRWRLPGSRRLRGGAAALVVLLFATGSAWVHGDGDWLRMGGGSCIPEDCEPLSEDHTNSPGCYKHLTDAELGLLLDGTTDQPFDPPVVCGQEVTTPDGARAILARGGFSPCRRLKRDVLTTMLNVRRSLLLGDGLLGQDGAACFGVRPFRIVLRCGDVYVPDPETPDPSDAVVVTAATPIAELADLASQLCELAACPDANKLPCGWTLGRLACILNRVNESRSQLGECGLCRGDKTPPVLSCPSGILEIEGEGPGGAPIPDVVTVVDDCDPAPDLLCFPPPGTLIPTGTTRVVECRATDLAGNVTSCSFEVSVVDTTPPSLSCPVAPLVVDCTPGPDGDGAVVEYPPPAAYDLCDPAPSVVCDPPPGAFFPLGVTVVTCTATDSSGNSISCSFEIHVVEETPAELYCPPDVVVEGTGPEGAVVEYPDAMLSTTCSPPQAPACDPASGSVFPLGDTVVTCTADDGLGGQLQCQSTVTVVDTTPPFVPCPGDLLVECASSEGTAVSFEVSAEDTCDPDPVVVCEPPSGSLFPTGQTAVTCTAVDASGNTSTCSFLITIVDTTPPEVFCPEGPIRVDCAVIQDGQPGALADFPLPLALDGCDPVPTLSLSHSPGDFFPLGTTTVNCTAADAAGNESTCSFDVEVVDQTPPMLVCLEDLLVECETPEGAVVDYPLPTVADECDGDPAVDCDPLPGTLFPPGPTVVSCTATDDSGNSMSCTFEVTVMDTIAPDLVCPADIAVECEGPGGTAVDFLVTATDACDPAPVVVSDPPAGSLFAPGLTVVECTATDASGNQSTCSFNVSVVDTLAPQMVCPQEVLAECESAAGTAVILSVEVVDTCSDSTEVVYNPPSGSLFPLGETLVTCTATDPTGNQSQCEFPVIVIDTTPPDISCPTEVLTIECTGENTARAAYPMPIVVDVCDTEPVVECDPPVDTVLPVGSHTVTCTATDAAGNSSFCSFEILVVDSALPALNCGGDVVVECTGPDGAVVEYVLPTPTDTCDPAPNLACLPDSGAVFPIGSTVVTCTADDAAGNMITCDIRITVVDTTPPKLECPGDIVEACGGPDGAPVSFTVTATDVGDPTPIVTTDPPSGHIFPIGTTLVTATGTDRFGNSASCEFTVTVTDAIPPEIDCPNDFETACLEGGSAVVEYPAPAVVDGCDPDPEVVCDPPSGTSLPLGAHVITCTAVDDSGNESTCEFTVTVVDATPPDLVCPANLTVESESPEGTAVDYPLPVANDACDGERPVTCVPEPLSVFALGDTEVVCRSADSSGNEVTCSFVISVRDTLAPQIDCPESIVAELVSPAGAIVEFDVTVSDLADPAPTLVCEPPSGSQFPPGQSTVTCTATDSSGNVAECTFTITVVDRTPPEVECSATDIILQGSTAGNPPQPHEALRWPPQEGPPVNAVTAILEYDPATAVDFGQEELPQVTCDPPSGSRLALGQHLVTCTARDAAGNESVCTMRATVVLGFTAFIRGDPNLDSQIDIADPVTTVSYLFLGGPRPLCLDAADANDDSNVDIADVIYTLGFLFRGGPTPAEPYYPLCGLDPTADAIDCERYFPCE